MMNNRPLSVLSNPNLRVNSPTPSEALRGNYFLDNVSSYSDEAIGYASPIHNIPGRKEPSKRKPRIGPSYRSSQTTTPHSSLRTANEPGVSSEIQVTLQESYENSGVHQFEELSPGQVLPAPWGSYNVLTGIAVGRLEE